MGRGAPRDRETLARDGFVVAMVTVDRETRHVIGTPQITSRGFVYLCDSEKLIAAAQDTPVRALDGNGGGRSARATSPTRRSASSAASCTTRPSAVRWCWPS